MPHAAVPGSLMQDRMGGFQWMAVGICVVLTMLDGFDVMVMAFTASHVSDEWQLSGKLLGGLLSAGLIGMAVGSLCVAPLADRWGRRRLILGCLAILTVAMGASAMAQNVQQLWILRAFTGLGIGAMFPSIGAITAEYASARWRSAAVVLQTTGYPIGAALGGVIAGVLLERWHVHWHAVFLFGAGCSLLCMPLVLACLPESLDFLVSQRPTNALAQLNATLLRMRHAPLPELPALPPRDAVPRKGYAVLFVGAMRRRSLLLALAFFLHMFAFFFVLSWTPKLLIAAGMSAQQGITGGTLLNLGGIVGGGVFSWLAVRWSLRWSTLGMFLLGALAMLAFSAYSTHLASAFAIALVIGAAVFAAMSGLYATAPVVFDASIRSTGLGWAIGIGRIGAILSPPTVGWLLDGGWSPQHLYLLCTVPLLLAAVALLALRTR
ncbi:MFS transporter [Xanthomonas translucens pv. translucens]|uniref:MFS transporter n=1 Tax=Xanthomonas campestris pv. translucens TaxID=343 RepID=UPI0019D5EC68|nr:MFS transporter [Xanthomonas translucens]MCT8286106.1 MFS transporter [Xanthomonas translucens pv. translucens]MCT8303764.1 MFS transporter [Xanthomonas translucens pv. translucens]QSQ30530.1 MFS transporter [Xanthomonas translucens pv. translucens]QSQ45441.1 MFS transporter [Xanthomonas translucens pv. translucens]UNT98705.1 MFS transporter [Xanthomonas translucens pv. translucens]